MPLDIDDEAILEDGVAPEMSPRPNLTSAFNLTSIVFWKAIQSRSPCSLPNNPCSACVSAHTKDRHQQISQLQRRIEDLKYALDSIPPELRQWAARPPPKLPESASHVPGDLISQFGSVRANLHVTHLWLRSILLDQLEAYAQDISSSSSTPAYLATVESRWSERENISSQLIHVLHAIPERDIEPNGLYLAYKVRDVAVGLLSCPFEPHEPASLRAAEFVREFTQIMSRLDTSEAVATTNLQTWVDTDRERGRGGRHDHMGRDSTFGRI